MYNQKKKKKERNIDDVGEVCKSSAKIIQNSILFNPLFLTL